MSRKTEHTHFEDNILRTSRKLFQPASHEIVPVQNLQILSAHPLKFLIGHLYTQFNRIRSSGGHFLAHRYPISFFNCPFPATRSLLQRTGFADELQLKYKSCHSDSQKANYEPLLCTSHRTSPIEVNFGEAVTLSAILPPNNSSTIFQLLQ